MTKYSFVKWAMAAACVAVASLASPVLHGQQAPAAQQPPATGEGNPTPAAAKPDPAKPEASKPRSQAPSPLVSRPGASAPVRVPATPPAAAAPAITPDGYVIGTDDVLSIVYWRDKDMSSDVQVRPDGRISLSLLNDIEVAGLTPEELRVKLVEASKQYIEDPNITVVVKTINSRKVYITGQVGKQGPYPLSGPTRVLQLISMAGGLGEYANSKNILIVRTEKGKQVVHKFNYDEVTQGKKLDQNIELRPGDTVIVR